MSQGPASVNPRDRSPVGLLRTARLIWRLMQDARVSPLLKLIVPASLLYLLFPLDLLPDFLVGPGQLDDLGIILFGLWLFLELVPKAIVREYAGEQTGGSAEPPPVDVSFRVVEDEPPVTPSEPPPLLGPRDPDPQP